MTQSRGLPVERWPFLVLSSCVPNASAGIAKRRYINNDNGDGDVTVTMINFVLYFYLSYTTDHEN